METPYLTIEETAKYLRLSEITIYRMIKRSEIPAAKIGRSWRIHREELEEYLESRVQPVVDNSKTDVASGMLELLEREIDFLVPVEERPILKKTS